MLMSPGSAAEPSARRPRRPRQDGAVAVTVAAGIAGGVVTSAATVASGVVRSAATTKTHKIICAALALSVLAAMAPGVDATGCPADSVAFPDPDITPAGAGVTAVAVSGVANENYLVFPASATPYTMAINRTVATQGDILLISGTQFVYAENVAILGEYTVDVSADVTALTGSRGSDLSTVDGSALAGESLSTTNDISGLVAHWKFDESSGGQLTDDVGENHFSYPSSAYGSVVKMDSGDKIFTGSVDIDTSLVSFDDASGARITTSTNTFSIDDTTQRTYSLWVKRNRVCANCGSCDCFDWIFAQPANFVHDPPIDESLKGTYFWLQFKSNQMQIYLYYGQGFYAENIDGSNVMFTSTETWLHIALIFNQSTISLYLNGVFNNEYNSWTKNWNVAGTLELGRGYRQYEGEQYSAKLNIDDFRIYDRVLTGDEINRIYLEGQGIFAHAITGNMAEYNTPQAIIRYETCGRASGCAADSLAVPDPGITPAGAGVTAVAMPGLYENYLVLPACATQYTVAIDSTVATQGDVLLISGSKFVYAENVVIVGDYTVQVSAEATALTGSRGLDMSTVDGSALKGDSLSETNDISGLVSHWKFDESSGNQLIDAIGGEHFSFPSTLGSIDEINKIFTGSVSIDTTSVPYESPGSSRITTTGNTFSINDATTRTYSPWVKRNRIGSDCSVSTCQDFILMQPKGFAVAGSSPGTGFWLYFWNDGLQWYGKSNGFFLVTDSNGDKVLYTNTETWIHIALIYNESAVSFYVDGELKGEQAESTYSWAIDGTLELGRGSWSYGYQANLNMDDFRIYDRALTGEEINMIYSEGQGIFAHAITGNMAEYNTPQAIIRYDTCGYPPPPVVIYVTQNVTFLLANGNVSHTRIDAAIRDSIREALAGNLTGGDTARVHVARVKDSPRRPGKEANMVVLVGGDDSDTPDGHAFMRHKADWVGAVVRQELERDSLVVCGCNAASFMDGNIPMSVPC